MTDENENYKRPIIPPIPPAAYRHGAGQWRQEASKASKEPHSEQNGWSHNRRIQIRGNSPSKIRIMLSILQFPNFELQNLNFNLKLQKMKTFGLRQICVNWWRRVWWQSKKKIKNSSFKWFSRGLFNSFSNFYFLIFLLLWQAEFSEAFLVSIGRSPEHFWYL